MVLARLKESPDLALTCAWLARFREEFNKGTVAAQSCPDLSPSSPLPEVSQFISSLCVAGCFRAAAPALELRATEFVST